MDQTYICSVAWHSGYMEASVDLADECWDRKNAREMRKVFGIHKAEGQGQDAVFAWRSPSPSSGLTKHTFLIPCPFFRTRPHRPRLEKLDYKSAKGRLNRSSVAMRPIRAAGNSLYGYQEEYECRYVLHHASSCKQVLHLALVKYFYNFRPNFTSSDLQVR